MTETELLQFDARLDQMRAYARDRLGFIIAVADGGISTKGDYLIAMLCVNLVRADLLLSAAKEREAAP